MTQQVQKATIAKPRMSSIIGGQLSRPDTNGLIIPSALKLGAPRKTLMDLSIIKEELSKLAAIEQSGDDM
jgi:hypothetical protein